MKTIAKLILGLAIIAGYTLLSTTSVLAGANGNSNNGGGGNTNNGNSGTTVTGNLIPPVGAVIAGTTPTIGWLIDRPMGHDNNGHGNNVDGVDSSNPGQGGGGPNGAVDESDGVDDEIRPRTDQGTNSAVGDNEIRQTDIETGIMMYIYSDQDEGEEVAQFPISAAGSEFELWADIAGVVEFMDNMMVGGVPPTAAFAIATQDPWVGSSTTTVNGQPVTQNIYRTRSDLSFSTTATVAGLSTDPTDPVMSRQLDIFHTGTSAARDDTTMTYPYSGPAYTIASSIADNSTPYSWSGLSRLTGFGSQLQKVGVETVQVQTLGGTWISPLDPTISAVINPWTVGNASVIVWPVASAYFTQLNSAGDNFEPFVNGQVVEVKIPNIYVNYRDLYPGATTFVQIYKGPHVMGQVGMPIVIITRIPAVDATAVEINNMLNGIAQNTELQGIVIREVDLQEHVNYLGNGTYTLEILSGGLPWLNAGAYESLANITFQIDQNVKVRGQIGTK